jgi:hypothetical protein
VKVNPKDVFFGQCLALMLKASFSSSFNMSETKGCNVPAYSRKTMVAR